MNARRPFAFWTAVIGFVLAMLWVLQDALLPFVAGFVVAYLLEPMVARLARRMPRWLAALLVLGTVASFVALVLIVLAPPLAAEAANLVRRLPDYAARLQAVIGEIGRWLTSRAPALGRLGLGSPEGEGVNPFEGMMGQGATLGATFLTSLMSGGRALLGALSLFVVAPVIAFYLLLDWDRMLATIDRCLPRSDAAAIRDMAREIDRTIGAFLRGQALVCLFLALWYGVGLLLVGLNFGFLVGLSSGLLSFVPYLGSVLGFFAAMAIGVVQFWPSPWPILTVAAVFAVGQFLESYVVTPKLVGDATGLHPVWIMFALFAGGALFGFAGVMLAVPVAAAIGVLVRHGLRAYLASPMYEGGGPDAAS